MLNSPEPSGTWGVLDSGIWLSLNVPGGWIYLAIPYVSSFPPFLFALIVLIVYGLLSKMSTKKTTFF